MSDRRLSDVRSRTDELARRHRVVAAILCTVLAFVLASPLLDAVRSIEGEPAVVTFGLYLVGGVLIMTPFWLLFFVMRKLTPTGDQL